MGRWQTPLRWTGAHSSSCPLSNSAPIFIASPGGRSSIRSGAGSRSILWLTLFALNQRPVSCLQGRTGITPPTCISRILPVGRLLSRLTSAAHHSKPATAGRPGWSRRDFISGKAPSGSEGCISRNSITRVTGRSSAITTMAIRGLSSAIAERMHRPASADHVPQKVTCRPKLAGAGSAYRSAPTTVSNGRSSRASRASNGSMLPAFACASASSTRWLRGI